MSNTMKRVIVLVFALAAVGCAAKVENMVVRPAVPAPPADPSLANGVYLAKVTGPEHSTAMWTSRTDKAGFHAALEQSLENYGLLNRNRDRSAYVLEAHLLRVDEPFGGYNMTVRTKANYLIRRADTGKLYLSETVDRSYTATTADSMAADVRRAMANEGAIRGNLLTFLNKLIVYRPSAAAPTTGDQR